VKTIGLTRQAAWTAAMFLVFIVASSLVTVVARKADAGPFSAWGGKHNRAPDCCAAEGPPIDDVGGTWYWMRSPEEEKRVVAGLYNRYCIRCHGVDGRGVWDIPDVPNFTNAAWQGSRSDGQLARSIMEGRGAVMPRFRGTLTLEESWAMARYLRTFVPGTEMSRPDNNPPMKPSATSPK
jgi:mono/diheme cytochrome c family protein